MAKKKTMNSGKTKNKKQQLKVAKRPEGIKLLLLIVLASIVGGFTVWISFAATPQTSYNKTVGDCKPGKSLTFVGGTVSGDAKELKAFNTCIDTHAEALVYRYYLAILGRQPEKLHVPQKATDGFVFWTNQLVAKKLTPERVAEKMLASNEAINKEVSNNVFAYALVLNVLKKPDVTNPALTASIIKPYMDKLEGKKLKADGKRYTRDEIIVEAGHSVNLTAKSARAIMSLEDVAFLQNIYTRLLGRNITTLNTADKKGMAYWLAQLKQTGTASPKMTRPMVVAEIAKSNEAITKNHDKFVAFVLAILTKN